jgi:hypothetical protein
MRAGYMPWSHTEEMELGRCRIYADLFGGNLMCSVPGQYYNSCEGWRPDALQELRRADGNVIWKDGTGAEHLFSHGKDDLGFICTETENEIKIRDACGNLLIFGADGRAIAAETAGGKVEYAYTGGRLTSAAGPGLRRVFAYDAGYLTVLAGKYVVFYEYSGDMLRAVRFGDGAPGIAFEYEDGRLAWVVCGNERVCVKYDEYGRVRNINGAEYAYFDGHTVVKDGVEWTYDFDAQGKCIGAGSGGRYWKTVEFAPGNISELLGI